MIISHKHRFVFVKTRKTAGTSIELSISRYCGPDDLIGKVRESDELMRGPGPGPQHHDRRARAREFRPADARELARLRWPRRAVVRAHTTAAHAQRLLGAETWERYVTFCVTRNPWDYVVSRLFWERHRHDDPTITVDQVLARWDPAWNWSAYTVNDEVIVDHVIDMGDMVPGVTRVLAQCGIEFDGWLPKAKADTGRNGAKATDVLEPRHVEQIAERCALEIARMGYSPPA